MSDSEESKWVWPFFLGFLLGVLVCLGIGGPFVMYRLRAMQELEQARLEEERARREAERAFLRAREAEAAARGVELRAGKAEAEK
jgi:hypothetical protein